MVLYKSRNERSFFLNLRIGLFYFTVQFTQKVYQKMIIKEGRKKDYVVL